MKLTTAVVALGVLAAASGSACAEGSSWGTGLTVADAPLAPNLRYGSGLKDMAVPAPIPVPAPVPVPEGFTYYLRADLSWGWNGHDPDFTSNGYTFGTGPAPFVGAGGSFIYGQSPQFTSRRTDIDDVFSGSVGFGAYFLPRLRGDLTLDFRSKQSVDASSTFSYASFFPASGTINGTVADTLKVSGTAGLANLYFDILPRGLFTPYVGAGIGFVYNDIDHIHLHQASSSTGVGGPLVVTGASKDTNFGLAGALMAGVSFSVDHRWALDVGYRALFLDGGSVTTTLSDAQTTKVTLEDRWEHQIRVGLRWNIW